jgi:hypothetical protein
MDMLLLEQLTQAVVVAVAVEMVLQVVMVVQVLLSSDMLANRRQS